MVALREVDAESVDEFEGFLVFDSFGNGLESERLGEGDDVLDQMSACCAGREVADELDVDLEVVDGKLFAVGQAAVSGSEVVER